MSRHALRLEALTGSAQVFSNVHADRIPNVIPIDIAQVGIYAIKKLGVAAQYPIR